MEILELVNHTLGLQATACCVPRGEQISQKHASCNSEVNANASASSEFGARLHRFCSAFSILEVSQTLIFPHRPSLRHWGFGTLFCISILHCQKSSSQLL